MDGRIEEIGSLTLEEAIKLIQEMQEDITEIYQYYHGDPLHLQLIFDKWVKDEWAE